MAMLGDDSEDGKLIAAAIEAFRRKQTAIITSTPPQIVSDTNTGTPGLTSPASNQDGTSLSGKGAGKYGKAVEPKPNTAPYQKPAKTDNAAQASQEGNQSSPAESEDEKRLREEAESERHKAEAADAEAERLAKVARTDAPNTPNA